MIKHRANVDRKGIWYLDNDIKSWTLFSTPDVNFILNFMTCIITSTSKAMVILKEKKQCILVEKVPEMLFFVPLHTARKHFGSVRRKVR